jgi:membrane-associated phospholipid phosphatase
MPVAEQQAIALGAKLHSREWWAVDKVIIAYLAVTTGLILAYFRVIPGAPLLLLIHAAAVALIVVARSNQIFHSWYPLPYVVACYKEMAILIPVIRARDFDRELARLDFALWGANPTVWLERMQSPLLTEFLQIVYSLFVPAVLVVAALLWQKRKMPEFRYYAFLIALGFLASYVGYFWVPVRGPRFLLSALQHTRLEGLWLFQSLQTTLDQLESAHYDCFPSGHTELTILACWGSRLVSSELYYLFLGYTPCIIFATVYLRYHYTIDVLAGMLLALLLIVAAPHVYASLGKRGR